MSETAPALDRRQQRTRAALLESFTALMFERRYDAFGVAEIAARANVGRSTFYEHFGSKDVVLRESMRPFLTVLADVAAGSVCPDRLRGVVDHIWESRRLGRIVFTVPMRPVIERQLAEAIAARLGMGARLTALQIAAAQISVIDAWISGAIAASPDEIIAAIAATRQLAPVPQ